MRYILGIVAAAAVALSSVAAQAADYAVLDTQRLLQDSKAAASIRSQIESKKNQYQAEISTDEKKLRDREKQLKEQQSVLSKEAFQEELKKFQQQVAQTQVSVQKKRLQLDKAYSSALKVVENRMKDISKSVALAKGYKLIVPAAVAVYYDPSLDVTSEVLSRLNSDLPRVDVEIKPIQ